MTASDGRERQLEELFAALEAGSLDAEQRQQLNALLRDDPQALDCLADQLEVEALLQWQHGQEQRPPEPQVRTRPMLPWLLGAAAGLLLAWGLWALSQREPAPAPQPPLVASWAIDAQPGTQYRILSARRVRLTTGELRVRSVATPAGSLQIETPQGVARAAGTDFLIGSHPGARTPQQPQREPMIHKSITRVLVLSGTVTLSNALGAAEGQRHDLLVAPQGEVPHRLVTRANNAFGIELFQALRKQQGAGNLFFSPFSLSTALSMAAEGARGRTAAEMGAVLHWPAAARRRGEEAQQLPFETSLIHSGHRQLRHLFADRGQDPKQQELRLRIAALDKEIAALDAEARSFLRPPKRDLTKVRALRRQVRAKTTEVRQLRKGVIDYELRMANSLWGAADYPFDPRFAQTLAPAYGSGSLRKLDFTQQPAAAAAAMNAWVEAATQGKFREFIDPRFITPDLSLVLLNTIYMRASWEKPFQPHRTRQRDFSLADGTKVKVPLMRLLGHDACRYAAFAADGSRFATPAFQTAENQGKRYPQHGMQALELFYKGGELSMLVLLPRDPKGLARLEEQLTTAQLERIVAALERRKCSVYLPRFQTRSDLQLKDTLAAMGMPSAFDRSAPPTGADFSGMSSSDKPADRLFISRVLHSAVIQVNEAGTEAAGVSGVLMEKLGSRPRRNRPFIPNFTADHPFLYLIRHRQSGAVLFFGRCVDPR